jgi:hypothetical protein
MMYANEQNSRECGFYSHITTEQIHFGLLPSVKILWSELGIWSPRGLF